MIVIAGRREDNRRGTLLSSPGGPGASDAPLGALRKEGPFAEEKDSDVR